MCLIVDALGKCDYMQGPEKRSALFPPKSPLQRLSRSECEGQRMLSSDWNLPQLTMLIITYIWLTQSILHITVWVHGYKSKSSSDSFALVNSGEKLQMHLIQLIL